MSLNVYIETLGCSKNQVDSEIMLGILKDYGYKLTNDKWIAEVIIINTCGFIESAKEESINTILELSEFKNKGNCKLLIVTGCLSERYSKQLSNELPEVDIFLGTSNFIEIAKVIEEAKEKNEPIIKKSKEKVDYNSQRILTTPNYTAYIKIAEGCDNFCTYCIIPKLRGKYTSRKKEDIIKEAHVLASQGVKELIVIAQDTTRYGIDIYNTYELSNLLISLSNIDGIEWIRLQYLYPDIFNDELIEVIANNKKICDYIDIPIQHCNNNILKRMNRNTTKEQILSLINKLRNKIPGVALRTSLIVGFPGESEEQFNELCDFVKLVEFDRLGVFTYSQEEDTPAAKFKNQVSSDIKLERQSKIMEIQKNISSKKNIDKIGNIYDILIEEKIEDENIYIGRTQYDSPEVDGVVYINSVKNLEIGKFVKTKITDALEYDLIGEIVK